MVSMPGVTTAIAIVPRRPGVTANAATSPAGGGACRVCHAVRPPLNETRTFLAVWNMPPGAAYRKATYLGLAAAMPARS